MFMQSSSNQLNKEIALPMIGSKRKKYSTSDNCLKVIATVAVTSFDENISLNIIFSILCYR